MTSAKARLPNSKWKMHRKGNQGAAVTAIPSSPSVSSPHQAVDSNRVTRNSRRPSNIRPFIKIQPWLVPPAPPPTKRNKLLADLLRLYHDEWKPLVTEKKFEFEPWPGNDILHVCEGFPEGEWYHCHGRGCFCCNMSLSAIIYYIVNPRCIQTAYPVSTYFFQHVLWYVRIRCWLLRLLHTNFFSKKICNTVGCSGCSTQFFFSKKKCNTDLSVYGVGTFYKKNFKKNM